MNGKFGNDVTEQQMTMVFVERIDTIFGQQAWPCKCHQATKLGALLLVVHVMYVIVSMLNKQRAQLKQKYAQRVRVAVRIVRIDDLVYEHAYDVVITV
jgi:hypothetical protein